MQDFSFQRGKALDLIAHHVGTLGGLQNSTSMTINPAQSSGQKFLGGFVTDTATPGQPQQLPMTTRIANAISRTPFNLFGRRRRTL